MTTAAETTVQLSGTRISLALPRPGDEGGMIEFHKRNHDYFKPWLPRPGGDLTDEGFWRNWIAFSIQSFQRGATLHLVLRHKADSDTVIGQVDYSLILRGPLSSTMVGFQLDKHFQGQGLMREALQTSLPFVFDTLKINRVVAAYVPDNARSERLLSSLGFVKEGIARDYLEIDGVQRDHVITARLARDAAPAA